MPGSDVLVVLTLLWAGLSALTIHHLRLAMGEERRDGLVRNSDDEGYRFLVDDT